MPGQLLPHIRATRVLSTIAREPGIKQHPGRHCVGMRSLESDILGLGGLAATHELYARGYGKKVLRFAVHTGAIVRVRKGWYCRPDLAVELQQAARVGGRLACVSAARYHGLWVPGQPGALHVQVPPDACQLRSRSDYRRRLSDLAGQHVVVHWIDGCHRVPSPRLGAELRRAGRAHASGRIRIRRGGIGVASTQARRRPVASHPRRTSAQAPAPTGGGRKTFRERHGIDVRLPDAQNRRPLPATGAHRAATASTSSSATGSSSRSTAPATTTRGGHEARRPLEYARVPGAAVPLRPGHQSLGRRVGVGPGRAVPR